MGFLMELVIALIKTGPYPYPSLILCGVCLFAPFQHLYSISYFIKKNQLKLLIKFSTLPGYPIKPFPVLLL
jgi:hypothetical protein